MMNERPDGWQVCGLTRPVTLPLQEGFSLVQCYFVNVVDLCRQSCNSVKTHAGSRNIKLFHF